MERVECPYCHTSYAAAQIGLADHVDKFLKVTIACMVCKKAFDFTQVVTVKTKRRAKTLWLVQHEHKTLEASSTGREDTE